MKTSDEFLEDITKYNLVSCYSLKKLEIGIKYSNGCGASGSWFRPPKTMWGVNIESTCIIHDIEWQLAKSYQDLLDANERFKQNLIKIITKISNFIMWLFRRVRVFIYTSSVDFIGTNNYARERGFFYEKVN